MCIAPHNFDQRPTTCKTGSTCSLQFANMHAAFPARHPFCWPKNTICVYVCSCMHAAVQHAIGLRKVSLVICECFHYHAQHYSTEWPAQLLSRFRSHLLRWSCIVQTALGWASPARTCSGSPDPARARCPEAERRPRRSTSPSAGARHRCARWIWRLGRAAPPGPTDPRGGCAEPLQASVEVKFKWLRSDKKNYLILLRVSTNQI